MSLLTTRNHGPSVCYTEAGQGRDNADRFGRWARFHRSDPRAGEARCRQSDDEYERGQPWKELNVDHGLTDY
jgi:hypothetical protein